MPEDYTSAAKRHLNDARFLEDGDQIDNADHLYGIAAECALKSALQSVGAFNATPEAKNGHKVHINTLTQRIQWTRFQRAYPGLVRLSSRMGASFGDWCVDQRYHGDGAVDPLTLEKHKDMTKRIFHAADLARG